MAMDGPFLRHRFQTLPTCRRWRVFSPRQYFPYITPPPRVLLICTRLCVPWDLWYRPTHMSVRMRHTRSHTNNRRSHHALTANAIVTDKESGALRLPHRLDESTGMYRGKQILPKKVMKAKAGHEKKVEKEKKEQDHSHVEGAKQPIHSEKEEKKNTGLMGRMSLGKAKSRSGFGGGA